MSAPARGAPSRHEHPPVRWLVLTASLTGRAASTARVRLWRALKDLGVGNLCDGVSLLPATAETRAAFDALAQEVEATRGELRFTAPLTAITAAVVGVILNLAVFFAWHTFWPKATDATPFAAPSRGCARNGSTLPGRRRPDLPSTTCPGNRGRYTARIAETYQRLLVPGQFSPLAPVE